MQGDMAQYLWQCSRNLIHEKVIIYPQNTEWFKNLRSILNAIELISAVIDYSC